VHRRSNAAAGRSSASATAPERAATCHAQAVLKVPFGASQLSRAGYWTGARTPPISEEPYKSIPEGAILIETH